MKILITFLFLILFNCGPPIVATHYPAAYLMPTLSPMVCKNESGKYIIDFDYNNTEGFCKNESERGIKPSFYLVNRLEYGCFYPGLSIYGGIYESLSDPIGKLEYIGLLPNINATFSLGKNKIKAGCGIHTSYPIEFGNYKEYKFNDYLNFLDEFIPPMIMSLYPFIKYNFNEKMALSAKFDFGINCPFTLEMNMYYKSIILSAKSIYSPEHFLEKTNGYDFGIGYIIK